VLLVGGLWLRSRNLAPVPEDRDGTGPEGSIADDATPSSASAGATESEAESEFETAASTRETKS